MLWSRWPSFASGRLLRTITLQQLQEQEERLLAAFKPAGEWQLQTAKACVRSKTAARRPARLTDRCIQTFVSAGLAAPLFAGPEAEEAAAAWLEASEPILATAGSSAAGSYQHGTPPNADSGPVGERRTVSRECPVVQKLPPAGLRGATSDGEQQGRKGRTASAASMGSAGGGQDLPRVSRSGSGSSAIAASPGCLRAERVSSYPLPDLGASGESSSGSEGTTPMAAGSGASTPQNCTAGAASWASHGAEGLQAAAAEAAAHALHEALPGGSSGHAPAAAAAPGAASPAHQPVKTGSAAELAPAGVVELDRGDSLDITRHTKHEKR